MIKDKESIRTGLFDLSWELDEGQKSLEKWEVAYITACVASAIKDIREHSVPREVRRVFERLSGCVSLSESDEVVLS